MSLTPPASVAAPSGSLLRILGIGFGIAVSLGGTIGVGILRAPGIVAARLPRESWILGAWGAGGVLAVLGTLCVIELGTSVPKAGAWYNYTREAFGDFPGFVIGWSFWLSVASALGYAGIALGEYLGSLLPGIRGQERTVGMAILIAFLLFQLTGLRPASRFQELTGFLKGAAFLTLISVGLFFISRRVPAAPPVAAAPPAPWLILPGLVAAMQSVIKTYDGWCMPCFFAEEDRNPRHNLPRSMLIGTGLVIVIYCGVNVALLSILSVPEIAASKLPVATAFARLFGGLTGKIITGLAVLNIVGLINTLYLVAPRILFAMARDGMFLRRASVVSPAGVPVFATVFSGVAGMATFFGGSFERVFSVSSVLTVVCYAAGFASLFALRRKHPDWPRPFRVWGYPIVPAAALLGSVLVLAGTIAEDRAVAIGAFCLVGLSYPVYLLIRRLRSSGSDGLL